MPKKRLTVIGMGGTITDHRHNGGQVASRLGVEGLLSGLPVGERDSDIEYRDLRSLPSRAIGPADMSELAHEIHRSLRRGADGVLVVHGTDTLEETAYALALQLERTVPIVLTGAMRLADDPGSDGPANLMAALEVARHDEAGALGPAVVMDGRIHLARWVAKARSHDVAAFVSENVGPVGTVTEGDVRIHLTPTDLDYLGLPARLHGGVDVIWAVAGSDGFLVEAAVARHRPIVVAGTGGGHVPPRMVEALEAAVSSGIPVVLASRCGSSGTLQKTYEGWGSETHLQGLGVALAGQISPVKARLRLMVGLELGKPLSELFPV